jgi:hypothetical protein
MRSNLQEIDEEDSYIEDLTLSNENKQHTDQSRGQNFQKNPSVTVKVWQKEEKISFDNEVDKYDKYFNDFKVDCDSEGEFDPNEDDTY